MRPPSLQGSRKAFSHGHFSTPGTRHISPQGRFQLGRCCASLREAKCLPCVTLSPGLAPRFPGAQNGARRRPFVLNFESAFSNACKRIRNASQTHGGPPLVEVWQILVSRDSTQNDSSRECCLRQDVFGVSIEQTFCRAIG